jgi:hypothetical protein
MVWKEGMAQWVPAQSIKGLFPQATLPSDGGREEGVEVLEHAAGLARGVGHFAARFVRPQDLDDVGEVERTIGVKTAAGTAVVGQTLLIEKE